MIEEAKKVENSSDPTIYIVADATIFQESYDFDLVTTQYLCPYASTKDDLLKMCQTAFKALKPGGNFVGVTTWLGSVNQKPLQTHYPKLGLKMTWEGSDKGEPLQDGICVQLTLLDAEGQDSVTFPNYLWSQETISDTIKSAGFSEVKWVEEKCCETASQEVKDWARDASVEFGLCGYFVAKKDVA